MGIAQEIEDDEEAISSIGKLARGWSDYRGERTTGGGTTRAVSPKLMDQLEQVQKTESINPGVILIKPAHKERISIERKTCI
jgi:hypothetical protein